LRLGKKSCSVSCQIEKERRGSRGPGPPGLRLGRREKKNGSVVGDAEGGKGRGKKERAGADLIRVKGKWAIVIPFFIRKEEGEKEKGKEKKWGSNISERRRRCIISNLHPLVLGGEGERGEEMRGK